MKHVQSYTLTYFMLGERELFLKHAYTALYCDLLHVQEREQFLKPIQSYVLTHFTLERDKFSAVATLISKSAVPSGWEENSNPTTKYRES